MKSSLMHEIEGKAVTNHHKHCLFIHTDSDPGADQVFLCRLHSLHEHAGHAVLVEYYQPDKYPQWSTPMVVACRDLRWFKKPAFTADDLLK